MKKRFGAFCLVMVMACTLTIPAGADVVNAVGPRNLPEPTVVTDKPELHLEYMDFYNNQEYYKNLVATEDYRLRIYVGEEYTDMEYARIMGDAETVDRLTGDNSARGTSLPTSAWNVVTQGEYNFSVNSDASTIYTNYYFSGTTEYLLTVFQPYNVSGGATVYGGIVPVQIDSFFGTVIERYSSLLGARFYVAFHAPAYIPSGSIEKAS